MSSTEDTSNNSPFAPLPSDKHEEAVDHTTSNEAVAVSDGDGHTKKNDDNDGDDSTGKKEEEEEEEEEEEPPKVGIFELFQFADNTDRALMYVGAFLSFCNGAAMPAWAFIFSRMIDELTAGSTDMQDTMARLAAIMCYIGIGVTLLSWIQVSSFTVAAERQSRRIREKYFEACMRQELAFHDIEKPGGLSARLFGDVTVIRNGINDKLGSGYMNFGMFIFGFAFGFWFSWRLTLVMLATLPLMAASGAWLAIALENVTKEARKGYSKAGDVSDEVMSNIRTVHAFGSEDKEVIRFCGALEEATDHGVKKEFMTVAGVGIPYAVMFASYGLAFWYASILVEKGHNTVGEITAVFFSVISGSMGVGLIFPTVGALSEARGAAHKVFSVINRESKIDPFKEGKKLDSIRGQIEFKDLVFSYPTRMDEKLFTGVNVTVEAGQNVAFSGASGCGKSSFIGLVQRLYDPVEGSVIVDGLDVKEMDLDWWRSQLGIVAQEPYLFTGTVKDNILVGKHDATQQEVEAACKKSNIHDTIMSLPDGYETDVGALGSQLSGGQKQRLAIARALIRKPKILILDEATSALDRNSEIEVQRAIDKLMKNAEGEKLTILVIAHRLATIRSVDKIFFIEHDALEGSKISETGTYTELMARGGPFAQMASRQSKSMGTLEEDEPSPEDPYSRKRLSSEKQDFEAAVVEVAPKADGETEGKEGEQEKKVAPLQAEVDKELEEVDASMGRVYRLIPAKWPVFLALIGSVLSGGLYPAYAVVFAKVLEVIGSKTPSEVRDRTPFWAGMFCVIAGVAIVGWLLQGFYGYAGEKLTVILRRDAFRAILRQDMTFFDMPGRDSGSLQKLLSGDCECVHQLWGPSIGTKVQMLCNLGAGVGIAFAYSWKIALVTIACSPIMIAAGAMQQMLISGFGALGSEQTATVVTESLQNIRTVTAFNLHKFQLERYSKSLDEGESAGIKLAIGAGLVFGVSMFAFYGVFALALWYGGKLMTDGELTFFDVMVSSMAVLMGAMGAGEGGAWVAKLADAESAAKRVFSVLDRNPAIDIRKEGDKEIGSVDMNFSGVEFIYPARPDATVLKGFTTEIKAGRTRGLVGSTGSGKSTLIQLLLRFYDPSKGTITIGGKDLKTLDIKAWREMTSAVLQEPSLFSGTIRDNIKYINPDATDADIEHYAKLASIHDEVVEMDKGYDTEVGYKGRNMSGGQKQRIALARALMRKPKVLFLDEATSALDNATEAKVQDGIANAVKEHSMSVVSIAHRLTTIRYMDRIMLLDNGVVLEEGSHDELMEKKGEYKRRWDTFMASKK